MSFCSSCLKVPVTEAMVIKVLQVVLSVLWIIVFIPGLCILVQWLTFSVIFPL